MTPAPFHAEVADAPPGVTSVWLKPGAMRIRVAWWKAGDKGTVVLPREVALHLRSGRLHRTVATDAPAM